MKKIFKIYFPLLLIILFASLSINAQTTDTIIIHFDFDRSEISPSAATKLDNIFTPPQLTRVRRLELYGHCDHIGNNEYNDALSMRRVEQTKNYLIQKGINENVITRHEGFGERQPLNENRTASERLMNRRVEVVVHWNVNDTVADKPAPVEEKKPPVTLTEIIRDSTRAGQNIILRNLQFQPGRHFLLPESQPILDELFQVLTDNPTLEIEIEGHVCCTPDNEDGLDTDLRTYNLSVQRAKAIYEHLVNRNIAAKRLSYRGFGGSRKRYQLERNDFERQENRRVELRIIKR